MAGGLRGDSTRFPPRSRATGPNLDLARELGGEVVTAAGTMYRRVLRLARQRNVTQIVVGKPPRQRLREILSGGPVVEKLIRHSGDIDVYVVTGDALAND